MRRILAVFASCLGVAACSGLLNQPATTTTALAPSDSEYEYLISSGDTLNVFVWRNPELSVNNVPVRPDGKISTPLVGDMIASGKTPKQLGQDIAQVLQSIIIDPSVSITVANFVGGYNQQVRVVGEAVKPMAIPYKKDMTLLDVMIQVGGLTQYADGNRAKLIRRIVKQDKQQELATPVRLEDLVKKGDISANALIHPGDVLIIPEAWF